MPALPIANKAFAKRGGYHRTMGCLLLLAAAALNTVTTGCGSSNVALVSPAAVPVEASTKATSLKSIYIGQSVSFSQGTGTCTWKTSNSSVLAMAQSGLFYGESAGSATASETCGNSKTVSYTVNVSDVTYSGPITITKGGTYSGNWMTTNTSVPAVLIETDEPVILQNSFVKGVGNLIMVYGSGSGANVQMTNVVGRAVNPNVAGANNATFFYAQNVAQLKVTSTTVLGMNTGIVVSSSTPSVLSILGNQAFNMDDRESDGNGGMLSTRSQLGHYILLYSVVTPDSAEIAWNQVINLVGQASTEDIINIYNSRGGSATDEILIHDNYLQGAVSTEGVGYSGGGITTDGSSNDPNAATGFVSIYNNQVVQTMNNGIFIASGHDVTAENNRVISSGKDASGNWLAPPGVSSDSENGFGIENFYGTSQFYNNTVTNDYAGLARPTSAGTGVRSDFWMSSASGSTNLTMTSNTSVSPSDLASAVTSALEQAEYATWVSKLASTSY